MVEKFGLPDLGYMEAVYLYVLGDLICDRSFLVSLLNSISDD